MASGETMMDKHFFVNGRPATEAEAGFAAASADSNTSAGAVLDTGAKKEAACCDQIAG